MGTHIQMTLQAQVVLAALLRNAKGDHYGLELAQAAGLSSGTIYPILARLEKCRWLKGSWENIDEAVAGRRKRRYYRLTALGVRSASRELERVKRLVFPRLADRPA